MGWKEVQREVEDRMTLSIYNSIISETFGGGFFFGLEVRRIVLNNFFLTLLGQLY
jgi:hypothetical protein